VVAAAAMAEGKAALMGFLAGGIVASGLFVMMQRRENKKTEKSARRQVFMKDEGLRPSLVGILQLFSMSLGVLVSRGMCAMEIVLPCRAEGRGQRGLLVRKSYSSNDRSGTGKCNDKILQPEGALRSTWRPKPLTPNPKS
jgi:hypothetical protein